MEIMKQRDPRWSEVHLGASKLTIGRFGCTTTCVAQALTDAGYPTTPDQIAHNVANYTPDGLILWQALKLPLDFVWRDVGFFPDKITEALKDPRMSILLEVANGSHWILLKRKTAGDWMCDDPWLGDMCGAIARYKNITKTVYFRDNKKVTSPSAVIVPDRLIRFRGSFLLATEQRGRLWYVTPEMKRVDLGANAEEVQKTIAKMAHGITDSDLNQIPLM